VPMLATMPWASETQLLTSAVSESISSGLPNARVAIGRPSGRRPPRAADAGDITQNSSSASTYGRATAALELALERVLTPGSEPAPG
jgi:hypothetical protein